MLIGPVLPHQLYRRKAITFITCPCYALTMTFLFTKAEPHQSSELLSLFSGACVSELDSSKGTYLYLCTYWSLQISSLKSPPFWHMVPLPSTQLPKGYNNQRYLQVKVRANLT